ncbi:hypothetical protein EDB89DRAFT_1910141 [Lactarius sanguifluus]|nr:hypothetical protein EDB89DRAFT_1910141 [Lactarius sanguifluus]
MSSGNTNGDGITTEVTDIAGRLLRRTSDYTLSDPFFSDDEDDDDAFTGRMAARTGRMPFYFGHRHEATVQMCPARGVAYLPSRGPLRTVTLRLGVGCSCATCDRWIGLNLRYLFMARHHNVLRALLDRGLTPILCVGAPSRGAETSVAVEGEGSGGEDGRQYRVGLGVEGQWRYVIDTTTPVLY